MVMNRTALVFALALFPALSACSVFEVQCDHLSQVDGQLECLDQAFMELRADADTCYDERRRRVEACENGDEAARGDVAYVCRDGDWYLLSDEDEDVRLAETKGGEREGEDEEVREGAEDDDREAEDEDRESLGDDDRLTERTLFCEGLEEADEDYERCRTAMVGLDGLHERTRGLVERSAESEERRRGIRRGLRAGRGMAECDRDRGGREAPVR